ncbi:MAG: response regulator transcription factor [Armatimonadota bacterium]
MAHRILVVDDEEDIRNLVAVMLKADGYQVVLASTGKDALQALEGEPIDLIVLDVMMPGMDGWEVCRQIKGNSRTKDIPVVFLTVRQQPLDRIIGTEVLHASGYIYKPFEREELLSTINECLTATAPPVI